MPIQAEWDGLFRDIGASFSVLRKFREGAELSAGESVFLFTNRDEFGFVPDPVKAFQGINRFVRGRAYSRVDDLVRLFVTEVTVGVTYTAEFRDELDNVLGTVASGTFGVASTIIPVTTDGPFGTLDLTAPVGGPGADQPVEVFVVQSGSRQIEDAYDGTPEEVDTRNSTQSSLRIAANNLSGTIFDNLVAVAIDTKLFRLLLAKFLGSLTTEIFNERSQVSLTGGVTVSPIGLLQELFELMETDDQTVKANVVSAALSSFAGAGKPIILFNEILQNLLPGKVTLDCITGIDDTTTPDGETFEVVAQSESLEITQKAANTLRINSPFKSIPIGIAIEVRRQHTVENDDPFNRFSNRTISRVTKTRLPLNKLNFFVTQTGPPTNIIQIQIQEPSTANIIADVSISTLVAFPGFIINCFNGLVVTLDITPNPSADGTTLVPFDLLTFPFQRGDKIILSTANDLAGRFQEEFILLRRFALPVSATPGVQTIDDGFVASPLPLLTPALEED